jgi:hypothetical protein
MTGPHLRCEGPIEALTAPQVASLLDRTVDQDEALQLTVSAIIQTVRHQGDCALTALARRFDASIPKTLEVPSEECERALQDLEPSLCRALERSARNLTSVHRAFLPVVTEVETEPGIVVGRPVCTGWPGGVPELRAHGSGAGTRCRRARNHPLHTTRQERLAARHCPGSGCAGRCGSRLCRRRRRSCCRHGLRHRDDSPC